MTANTKPKVSAYGYIRVSGDRQVESGLGLEAQAKAIKDYCHSHGLTLARVFRDEAVSASRHPLSQRPQGAKLIGTAGPGDHVVIAKLDRAFRSLRDFATELDRWQRRGVVLHLLDLNIDSSTPVGKLIASVMAAVAEWEARRIGERIKAAYEVMRTRGLAPSGRASLGHALVRRRKGAPRLVADIAERKIMRRIVKMRRSGLFWREIAERLAQERVKTRDGRLYSQQRCWRCYHAELDLQGQKVQREKRRSPPPPGGGPRWRGKSK